MSKLHIELNQSVLRGGQRMPQRTLARTLRAIELALKLKEKRLISVAFVTESEMKRLNKTWRGKNRVTDVLSFPLSGEEAFGEVLVNYAQAARQAREMGHSTRAEICFLLVHGILHVFGFDHERPEDAKIMFPLQSRILTSLGINPRV